MTISISNNAKVNKQNIKDGLPLSEESMVRMKLLHMEGIKALQFDIRN